MNHERILEAANPVLTEIIGNLIHIQIYLAGGYFKTLLSGLPVKDLDLWVPDKKTKHLLIQSLLDRGAVIIDDKPPFFIALRFERNILEFPYNYDGLPMESCLSRFDIALSAIGVEYNCGRWKSFIHPSAAKSFKEKKLYLIHPFNNWKYALVTLDRLNRYHRELNFEIVKAEVDYLWDLFDTQNLEEKIRMIKRYKNVPGWNQFTLKAAITRVRQSKASLSKDFSFFDEIMIT
ncbi:hypothetical protein KJ966_21905 [bacterium]|nr:hypothetical protein [bacterium]